MDENIFKILISLIAGAIIGMEREYNNKPAGFRTLILICVGSTLVTILSIDIGVNNSPDRIIANILTGIGFIGAGVIFKFDDKITGLTTAALIWVVSALGISIGAGYYYLSGFVLAIIMLVLIGFRKIEIIIDRQSVIKDYRILCNYKEGEPNRLDPIIESFSLRIVQKRQALRNGQITSHLILKGSEEAHKELVNHLLRDPEVKEIDF